MRRAFGIVAGMPLPRSAAWLGGRSRRLFAVAAIVAVGLVVAGAVIAFFVAGSTSGSYGAAQAGALPAGNTPSAPSVAGRDATVSWSQNSPAFLGGLLGANANGGYLIQRYAASGGSAVVPGAACAGLRQGSGNPLSCTESSLPTGRWQYTVTPKYYNWLGAESAHSASATIAPANPSSVTLVNGAGAGNAFINSSNASSLSFDVALPSTSLSSDTITLTLTSGATSVSATQSGTSGAGTVHFTGVNGSSLPDGAVTITARAASSYGDNSAGSASLTRTKDTVGPANALTLVSQSPAGSSFRSGPTVYYRGTGGGSGGSFAIQNAVSDAGSGAALSSTAALGGSTSGWSHTPSTVSTPSGGPYVSNAYSWTEGTTSSPTEVVTGADGAGNTTAAATLTFTNDSTAPTGGAVTANGSAAFNTTGTVSLSKVDFTDAGAGIASNALTRASATLANNACASFGGAATVTISGGNDSASLATGCYRYTLTGTDNVGNTATAQSTIVKVDTSPPATPTLAFGGLSANTFYGSSLNTLYVRPAAGGTFSVTASSSDADTNIQGYTFNSLNTDGGSGFGGSQSGNRFDYTFGAGTTAPTTQRTVLATNNAGASSANASYSIVSDTTAPTGGTISANGGATYNTSGTISLSSTIFAEAQSATASGLATGTNAVTRATATLTNNVCGSFSGAVAVSTPSDTVPSDACYRYTLTGLDNVGNQATATSTIVKVDTVKPSTSDNSASIGNGWKNTTQTVTLTPTDTVSGVANTYYTTDGSTPTTASSQGTSVVLSATGVYTLKYFSVDNAGNQEAVRTAGTQIRIDTVAPTNSLALGASPSGAFLSGTTLYYKGNAAGSFTLVDTVADANSGPASATYPAIATGGWTHANEIVSTPSGGPYTSSTFSWSVSPSNPSAKTITGTDVAGNTTGTTITFATDTTAPSGGSVTVPAFTSSTTVPVTFSAGSDSESGVKSASGQLSRASAIYSPSTGTCGGFGAFTNIGSAGPTSPFSDSGRSNGTCYQYQYTVLDNVGNSVTYTSNSVAVDTTAPNGSDIQATNVGGGTLGRPDQNDTITFSSSEKIDPNSILSGWSGSTTSVTVRLDRNGTNGAVILTVWNAGNSAQLNLGSVDLGQSGYLANTGTKHAVISGSTMVQSGTSITVTLGGAFTGDAVATAGTTAAMAWTPSASGTDLAGNAMSTTIVNETGAADKEF